MKFLHLLGGLSLLETFFSFGIFLNSCSSDSFKSGAFLVLKISEIRGNYLCHWTVENYTKYSEMRSKIQRKVAYFIANIVLKNL
jgi:hypothetical protein